jgi:4-carboxymuconolactone decarboxylase
VTDRYERGLARQASMRTNDTPTTAIKNHLSDIAPDLQRLVVEFAYGDIHSRPGLDAGKRQLVIIAALTALGDTDRQVQTHVGSALGAGETPEGIVEAIMQTIPYVGFPRAIKAIESCKAAFEKYDVLKDLPGSQE